MLVSPGGEFYYKFCEQFQLLFLSFSGLAAAPIDVFSAIQSNYCSQIIKTCDFYYGSQGHFFFLVLDERAH